MLRLLSTIEQAVDDAVVAPVATVVLDVFSRVESIQACPVPVWKAEAAEMRRFIATRRERHSENASRLREMEGWADRVKHNGGRWSREER